MANLNFEQPPRSIANTSLTSRAASGGGGLNTVAHAGHVTPTSGMFSGSSASTSNTANSAIVATNVYPGASSSGGGQNSHQQQQLSPMGSRGLFGQRAFTDRRTMPALGLVFFFFLYIDFSFSLFSHLPLPPLSAIISICIAELRIQWVVWAVLEYLQVAITDLKVRLTISTLFLGVEAVEIRVLHLY